MTTPHEPKSHCHIETAPDGVRIRCRRVPLAPAILLTVDQWAQLADRLAEGGLPDFAVELPGDSWVTKIAPPGQEANALYLWNDELAALADEIRGGRHTNHDPVPVDQGKRAEPGTSGFPATPSSAGVPAARTALPAGFDR